MECLACGEKTSNYNENYMINPTMVIVPCMYFLCEKHKDLIFSFEDVYEINEGKPKRKDIDNVFLKGD